MHPRPEKGQIETLGAILGAQNNFFNCSEKVLDKSEMRDIKGWRAIVPIGALVVLR
jgi:hypothetical protein